MKLLTNFLYLSLLLVFSTSIYAQSGKTYKEKSDPEATKILKKLKGIYGKYDGLQIKYTLEIEYGDEKEVQEGEIFQHEGMYHINNNGNIIINDGKTVWMYIKKQNEVQINDYDPEENDFQFTPAQIFNMDEDSKDFVYVITGEDSKGYKIEFKPTDSDSEIMKIRIEVDKAQTTINSVKVFQDDGTRMTFLIKDVKNVKPTSTSFKFNKAKYPGVKEINLRD